MCFICLKLRKENRWELLVLKVEFKMNYLCVISPFQTVKATKYYAKCAQMQCFFWSEFSVFSPNTGNMDQKKLRIWTLLAL